MKKLSILLLIVVAAGLLWIGLNKQKNTVADIASSTPQDTISTEDLVLTKTYRHPTYKFSFTYPERFAVTEPVTSGGASMLVVQNDKGQGFQIQLQEIDEDLTTITPERIHQDLPDMAVNEPQDVIVGTNGKGLAFISDDETFGSGSREVWFVYNKVFYQISTYKRYDPLLQAVLGTWKFE